MILGAEIGLFVMGVIALVKGKLTLSKTRVVYGTPARLLAIIAFLPLPLAFSAGVVYGVILAAQGREVTIDSVGPTMIGIEVAILVACIAAMYGIGWAIAKPAADVEPTGRA